MIRVVANVDFATVWNFSIAIGKPLFAIAHGAHRIRATTKCIGSFAFGAASATILPVLRQLDFTTVKKNIVAIGKPSIARNAAGSSITRCPAIDAERTGFITATAIVDVVGRVRTRLKTTCLA